MSRVGPGPAAANETDAYVCVRIPSSKLLELLRARSLCLADLAAVDQAAREQLRALCLESCKVPLSPVLSADEATDSNHAPQATLQADSAPSAPMASGRAPSKEARRPGPGERVVAVSASQALFVLDEAPQPA
ncbi:MAG: hypothetical protein AAF458_20655 [Pseudomonadota bacterium]